MFYIYRDLTIAGWIAFAVFFLFLGGFAWAKRLAWREERHRGFDVMTGDTRSGTNRKDDAIS